MKSSDFIEIMGNYDLNKVDDVVSFATEIANKITDNDVRYKSAQTYFVITMPYVLEYREGKTRNQILKDLYNTAVKLFA